MNKVWIKQGLLDRIFSEGNKSLPKETGGILMGYRVSLREVVITDIVGPGKNAVHESMSFHPDQAFHEKEIERIYKESGKLITYLGDWHTHPNSHPYLSSKDKQTIVSISKFRKARLSNPLMLIAAPPKNDFKVWTYSKSKISKQEIYLEGNIIVYQ